MDDKIIICPKCDGRNLVKRIIKKATKDNPEHFCFYCNECKDQINKDAVLYFNKPKGEFSKDG